jgi:DNA-binding winged helix-turn-helix (wHTH) protein
MRVVLVNGERADEIGLVELLRKSRVDCVMMRISATCLHADQNTVWCMASRHSPEASPLEAYAERHPRGLLFELTDPFVEAVAAIAAIRSDRRFDAFPAIASVSIDRIGWISRAREFDDFVLFPWSPIELIGRIHAAECRRPEARVDAADRIGDGVSIDASLRQVTIDGGEVRLTAREYSLLQYLWARRGTVLSREHLLQHVWGQDYHGGARTVDVHVRRLRSKLGTALPIDTVRGGGYRLVTPPGAPHGLTELVPEATPCPPTEVLLAAVATTRDEKAALGDRDLGSRFRAARASGDSGSHVEQLLGLVHQQGLPDHGRPGAGHRVSENV